jgi:hypothetical protein
MKYKVLMGALFIASLNEAKIKMPHYTVKVRNHTDQDVKVTIDRVIGGDKSRIVKKGEREDINIGLYSWRGMAVETTEGEKRKGSGGATCDFKKTFVRKKNNKEYEYYADCYKSKTGHPGSDFFDVFLPSQGTYRKKAGGHTTIESIKDTGDNLIVVSRMEGAKY